MADITEYDPASAEEIARSRWRADLLQVAAAEIRRIVGSDASEAARTMLAQADQKDAEATIHLDQADAMQTLAEAKMAYDADPSDDTLQYKRQKAMDDIAALWSYWRGIGEAVGSLRSVQTVNDFAEPSTEAVLESHGGEA